jgi:hypothetical protein
VKRSTHVLVRMAAVAILLLPVCYRADAQWGDLKGQVVFGGDKIPARAEIPVNVDKDHCLSANKTANLKTGTILDEVVLINPKNKGIRNVFVWLMNDPDKPLPIHPNLVKFPAEVVIDQPACMFFPRALAMREGQVFVVKNSSPVPHNINWTTDPTIQPGGNVVIKPGGQHEIKNLKAQFLPVSLACNLHGWMKGRLAVFNHPYFAITDADGNFEIKNAPVGKWNMMILHEEFGYRVAKKGEPIELKAGVNDLGKLPMGQ